MEPKSQRQPKREEFTLLSPIRIIWGDVDAYKIVYYRNYFRYFDHALSEYMKEIGFPFPTGFSEAGAIVFMINVTTNFHRTASYDDGLVVGVRVANIGRSSVRFELAVFCDSVLVVDGSFTYVTASSKDGLPTAVPRTFTDRVLEFERVPPDKKI